MLMVLRQKRIEIVAARKYSKFSEYSNSVFIHFRGCTRVANSTIPPVFYHELQFSHWNFREFQIPPSICFYISATIYCKCTNSVTAAFLGFRIRYIPVENCQRSIHLLVIICGFSFDIKIFQDPMEFNSAQHDVKVISVIPLYVNTVVYSPLYCGSATKKRCGSFCAIN